MIGIKSFAVGAARAYKRQVCPVVFALLVGLLYQAAAAEKNPDVRGEYMYGLPPGVQVDVGFSIPEDKQGALLVFPVPVKFCPRDVPEGAVEADSKNFQRVLALRDRDPRVCLRHLLLANHWHEKYKNIVVAVVDREGPQSAVMRMVHKLGIDPGIILDMDLARKVAINLRVNRAPIAMLLDRQGVIKDKVGGFGLARWVEFDEQLRRANDGDWVGVGRTNMREALAGRAVEYWPPGVRRGKRYTLVINEFPGCPPCIALARYLSKHAGDLLKRHPDLAINVLVERSDRSFTCKTIDAWTSKYGSASLPYPGCPPPNAFVNARALFPPDESLPERFHVIPYDLTDANDIGRWWGVFTAPSAVLIEGNVVLARDPYQELTPRRYPAGTAPAFDTFFARLEDLLARPSR